MTLLPAPEEPEGGQDDPASQIRTLAAHAARAARRSIRDVLAWVVGHRNWPVGMCLMFARSAHALPARYPSAKAAWSNAEHRHERTPDPPVAVPVFWRGGKFWHVAISAGGGKVWSTDILRRGRVDLVPIAAITQAWHYEYLGWTEDLNGFRVWEAPTFVDLHDLRAAATRDRLRLVGLHPQQTNRIRKALGMRKATGRWTRAVTRRWKKLYPRSGGKPTAFSLRDFADKHHLTYRD